MRALLRTRALLAALAVGALAALLMGAPGARSQTGGAYSLSWNTIDGGGITVAQGGAYALGGTVGQPDTGAQGGGQYSLEGGFWSGASGPGVIYLPLVQR